MTAYSRQIGNTQDRHYLVKEAKEYFDNVKISDGGGGETNTEVYKILGEVILALRTSRNSYTTDIAGFALAYIYNNYLNAAEQSDFQTETSLS